MRFSPPPSALLAGALFLTELACTTPWLAGCSGTEPAAAPRPEPAAWTRCYRDFEPSGDAPLDLDRLAEACGPPTGLTAVTPVQIGAAQAQDDPSERFAFRARAGRCYRFFSVGDAQVTDLDVAVLDPEGRLAAADASRDAFPVVPPRGPLCVEQDGVYTVEVAVAQGRGSYVLQVWGRVAMNR